MATNGSWVLHAVTRQACLLRQRIRRWTLIVGAREASTSHRCGRLRDDARHFRGSREVLRSNREGNGRDLAACVVSDRSRDPINSFGLSPHSTKHKASSPVHRLQFGTQT